MSSENSHPCASQTPLNFLNQDNPRGVACANFVAWYCGGMKTPQMQCPNCDSYKVRSVSGHWAAMAMLSIFFVVTAIFVPVFLILSVATLGKYECRQCGWKGKKANILANA